MRPSLTNATVLAAALLMSLAGAVDAALTGAEDLVVVLVVVAALIAVPLGGLGRQRVAVPLRRDLVRWLRSCGHRTGERPEVIADRALAAYRAALADAARSRDRTGP